MLESFMSEFRATQGGQRAAFFAPRPTGDRPPYIDAREAFPASKLLEMAPHITFPPTFLKRPGTNIYKPYPQFGWTPEMVGKGMLICVGTPRHPVIAPFGVFPKGDAYAMKFEIPTKIEERPNPDYDGLNVLTRKMHAACAENFENHPIEGVTSYFSPGKPPNPDNWSETAQPFLAPPKTIRKPGYEPMEVSPSFSAGLFLKEHCKLIATRCEHTNIDPKGKRKTVILSSGWHPCSTVYTRDGEHQNIYSMPAWPCVVQRYDPIEGLVPVSKVDLDKMYLNPTFGSEYDPTSQKETLRLGVVATIRTGTAWCNKATGGVGFRKTVTRLIIVKDLRRRSDDVMDPLPAGMDFTVLRGDRDPQTPQPRRSSPTARDVDDPTEAASAAAMDTEMAQARSSPIRPSSPYGVPQRMPMAESPLRPGAESPRSSPPRDIVE